MLKKINLLRFFIILLLYLLPYFVFENQFDKIKLLSPDYLRLSMIIFFVIISLLFTYIISKFGYVAETKNTYLLLFIHYILITLYLPILITQNYYYSFCINLFIFIVLLFLIFEFYTYKKKLIYFILPYLCWILILIILSLTLFFA